MDRSGLGWRCRSTWFALFPCFVLSTGFALLACDRRPSQGGEISPSANLAPAPAPSLGPQKATPVPGQEATPEALLDLTRIDCNLPASPKAERQDARSEPLCFTKDLLHGVCESAKLVVDHSSKWGWVARVESRRHGSGGYSEWSSDYLMGRGAVDECGTATYRGARYPGFSDQVRGLLATSVAKVHATLINDHQRSKACPPAHGAISFGESTPGISHETAYERPMFGKHSIQMEPTSELERSGVCPFYTQKAHPVAREEASCEQGTYFAEENLPALGRLVMLSDFSEECTDKERGQISGARFYLLGWGEVDRCGSVHYRRSLTFGVESVFGYPGLRSSRHTLEMFDHRARQASPLCPARVSTIELRETVEIFEQPTDSSQKATPLHGPATRSFYSPKELTPGARRPPGAPE